MTYCFFETKYFDDFDIVLVSPPGNLKLYIGNYYVGNYRQDKPHDRYDTYMGKYIYLHNSAIQLYVKRGWE